FDILVGVFLANFDPGTFSLMRCEFCGAGFDTRAGLSSHARAHLRDYGITNWELTVSPIHILKELLATAPEHPALLRAMGPSLQPDHVRGALWGSSGTDPGRFLTPNFPFFPLFPASSLTTCEVCGACFETRKGLSSHARSHLRQLGVAESESSGAPIDLLYELVRHKPRRRPAGQEILVPREPPNSHNPKPPPAPLNPFSPAFPASGSKPCCDSSAGNSSGIPKPSPAPFNPFPCRDIRCEFCGEFFENRKGLSSHARSHLRQMGVTEWYVNGSPIDTLREILTRRRSGHPKPLAKSLLGGLAPLEPPRARPELHLPPGLGKKVPAPLSPPGPAPGAASPPPPTARKMFPGLSAPSLQKKLKQDQLRVEIKRELMAGAGGGGGGGIHPGEAPAPPDPAWAAHEEMAPLNLSSRADPVRDIRCEFCGEFFENRKGLSSHARSHLRQMGVTEWSVNGSPIDTLREILRKKSKPCLIKKEPPEPKAPPGPAPGKALPPGLALGKPGSGLALAPLGSKNAPGAFLAAKRPLGDTERLGGHGEAKHKGFELGFKAKALHDKASAEACCELCGLYFENRKALASHARAHLRQFGVTEWCVNGSPTEAPGRRVRTATQGRRLPQLHPRGGAFSREVRGVALREVAGALPAQGRPGGEGARNGAGKAMGNGAGPLGLVKVEEQRGNFSKFERRQARPLEPPLPREAEPGAAPVPALVPRPPQTSLVKFVGNIYTLKCRFCEVQFQGPLSIQEQWLRHLQRHILAMNFSSDSAPFFPPKFLFFVFFPWFYSHFSLPHPEFFKL
uniref:Uncharacterized protein n=1 Tax=Geospiza parvula TaxID=87175 RepID=A0A8U8BS97_GEOPR